MKAQINRIASVSSLGSMLLEVTYQGGQKVKVDCTELPRRFAVFAQLQDPAFFNQVEVADWGHGIEWPNGEGLGADKVLDMALEQAQRTDTLVFRNWQQKHGLSLAQVAQILGMSRRTISQYRTGMRPVPRTVLLALKGWEVEHANITLSTVFQ